MNFEMSQVIVPAMCAHPKSWQCVVC